MLTKKVPIKYARVMRDATLRDFSGGWNTNDEELNLAPKYSTVAENISFRSDGTWRVRYGTRKLAACAASFSTPNTSIINIEYYNAALIAVGSNGEVVQVLGDGTVTRVWSTAIAALLPGAPAGWSTTDFASFAQFNGKLIICNGVDKPIVLNNVGHMDYLQDAGTNTNINVPIARYVVSASRYLIMAGDIVNPNRVHISARDAEGTWFGDPPPNDATRVDVGSILAGSTVIRGLLPFRDKLLVLYAEGTVIGTLGTYDDANNHTPSFNDVIEGYGGISHRAATAYGDDGLITDLIGLSSIKRTVLSTSLKPERSSELISSKLTEALAVLTPLALEDRVFAVFNSREGELITFIPNAEAVLDTTQTTGYVYTYRPKLGQETWSRYNGWNWTCGCRSLQGNVFFADASANIWFYGNRDDPVYADFIDLTLLPPNTVGTPITFQWKGVWIDFKAKASVKNSKYIEFDTRGTAEVTASMYVDNIKSNVALTTQFSGGDQGGFGSGSQPFGGGRNTSYKKQYGWPAKFKMAQFEMTGSISEEFGLLSMTLYYQQGGSQR